MSEFERKLLSKMTSVKDLTRIHEMGGVGFSEVFEDPINCAVFEWMRDYWLDSRMELAPTWVVIETEFPSVKLDHDVGESVEWLVSYLQQRYTTNKAQDLMIDAAKTLSEDPIATMQNLWRGAYDITERTAPRNTRSNMADEDDIAGRDRDYLRRSENQSTGVMYGLPMVDEHTGGMLPGELIGVAAYTKVGKSFMLCHTAIQAHMAGLKPILFTLEMSIMEMKHRIDAFNSGVSYSQITDGSMMPADLERLRESRSQLAQRGDLLVERPQRGERTVKYMVNRARQVGADIMMIDQLSFMDSEGKYGGDQAMRMKHGEIVFDLKDEISRESAGALPCMLAVQLNRETMRGDNGGRGALQNFANSSFIEQTVDIAFGLWRNEHMRASNAMGMDIMGSRRSDRQNYLLGWRLHDRTEIVVRGVNEE